MDETSQRRCPSCRETLADNAVLCIACGYHLGLGKCLATEVEPIAEAHIDSNPYAAPAMAAVPLRNAPGQLSEFDLTESGARQAKAVVDDAGGVYLVILLSFCVCGIAWFVMLPWYAYRLWMWHSLYATFAELRRPSSLSPHAAITTKFPDAKLRLWLGIGFGAVYWVLIAISWVLRMTPVIVR